MTKRCPKSEGELWGAIEEEFNSIDESVTVDLHQSIRKKFQASLQSKDAHTKYLFWLLNAINAYKSVSQ